MQHGHFQCLCLWTFLSLLTPFCENGLWTCVHGAGEVEGKLKGKHLSEGPSSVPWLPPRGSLQGPRASGRLTRELGNTRSTAQSGARGSALFTDRESGSRLTCSPSLPLCCAVRDLFVRSWRSPSWTQMDRLGAYPSKSTWRQEDS